MVRVEREGNAVYVYNGYRAAGRTYPDWFKLALVNSAWSGARAPGGQQHRESNVTPL